MRVPSCALSDAFARASAKRAVTLLCAVLVAGVALGIPWLSSVPAVAVDTAPLPPPPTEVPTLSSPTVTVPTLPPPPLEVPTLTSPTVTVPTLPPPPLEVPTLPSPIVTVPTLPPLTVVAILPAVTLPVTGSAPVSAADSQAASGAVSSAKRPGAASDPADAVRSLRGRGSGRGSDGRYHRVSLSAATGAECLAAIAAGSGTPASCPTVKVAGAEAASGPGVLARTGVALLVVLALGAILFLSGWSALSIRGRGVRGGQSLS
jgi:hypothetical protein